jgi:tetratricopeptide (TPR) repeat protein
VLSDADDGAIRALELAAVLGLDVDEGEWRACLALVEGEFPADAVQDLLSHRLIEQTDTGVRFVHSMLRESIERRAIEDGRLIEHNRVCARMLSERYDTQPRLAERLGRHLLAARAYLDAFEPLLEGAKARGNSAELDAALVLLDLHLDAINALDLPEVCAPRVDNAALRALALAVRGEYDSAETLATRALDAAKQLDVPCRTARCLVRLAQCHLYRHDYPKVSDLLETAKHLAHDACCHDELLIQIGELAGIALAFLGEIEEATRSLKTARKIAVECGDVLQQIAISRQLGSCERRRGNFSTAESMLREAVDLCERVGLHLRVADTVVSLADVVRLRGRLDEAAELYRKAINYSHTVRHDVTRVAQLNLALICVQRDQFDDARPMLEALRPQFERAKLDLILVYVDALSLSCIAHELDWTSFEPRLDQVLETIERHHIVDADMAICLEKAATLALDAQQLPSAARAFEAAAEQWERSGNEEKTRAIRKQLDRIDRLAT